jgi:hypothetical protein
VTDRTPQQSGAELRDQSALSRWLYRLQRVNFGTSALIVIGAPFVIGGWWGFLGIPAGIVFFLLVTVLILCVMRTGLVIRHHTGNRSEIARICDDAVASKDYEAAINRMRDHIVREGESTDSLFSLGCFLLEVKRYEEAMDVLTRATNNPSSIHGMVEISRAFALGKSQGADAGLEALGSIDRSWFAHPSCHCMRAMLLADAGRFDEARTTMAEADKFVRPTLAMRLMVARKYRREWAGEVRTANEYVEHKARGTVAMK